MKKVRWGVLGTASIATRKVIPAMQESEYCDVVAIASRDIKKAMPIANEFGILKAFDSYEKLLADIDIDAVYIPLPNHLHVEWSIKALKAGKHVLCEKPVAMTVTEARKLFKVSKRLPEMKIMEAFMYRHHPQWQRARQLVLDGGIGELRTIHSFFSYYNKDAENIRNKAEMGGGGLMDIGCYCISLSRFIFGSEPWRVLGVTEIDHDLQIDRLASGILHFKSGTATFTCSTQLSYYQRVTILGTHGHIELEIPFNAPPDKPCKIWHHSHGEVRKINIKASNQFTLQCDLFSQAILNNTEVPTPLSDAVENMRIIEAVSASAKSKGWIELKD